MGGCSTWICFPLASTISIVNFGMEDADEDGPGVLLLLSCQIWPFLVTLTLMHHCGRGREGEG